MKRRKLIALYLGLSLVLAGCAAGQDAPGSGAGQSPSSMEAEYAADAQMPGEDSMEAEFAWDEIHEGEAAGAGAADSGDAAEAGEEGRRFAPEDENEESGVKDGVDIAGSGNGASTADNTDAVQNSTRVSAEEAAQPGDQATGRRFAPEKSEFDELLEEQEAAEKAKVTAKAPADFHLYDGPDLTISFRVLDSKAADWEPEAFLYYFPTTEPKIEKQLEELSHYWSINNMDAVDDLMRLPRYRYVSEQLAGSRQFFYFGEENEKREPDGTGIAVYAGNCYYYGGWKDGVRSGEGTWIQVFNRDGDFMKKNNGVYLHSYSGTWADDLPNGKGHEHLSLEDEYIAFQVVTNVIGSFKDGYYDGDEYLVTRDEYSNVREWDAFAVMGTFTTFADPKEYDPYRIVPVAINRDDPEQFIPMKEELNRLQGITGLLR